MKTVYIVDCYDADLNGRQFIANQSAYSSFRKARSVLQAARKSGLAACIKDLVFIGSDKKRKK